MNRPASFPIPVLGSRDDIGGELAVKRCSVNVESGLVTLELEIELHNRGILEQVQCGSAVYAMRLSCRRTYYRRTWCSSTPLFKVTLPQHEFSDRIKIHPFVVAANSITEYRPSDLNDDYGDDTFSVRQGQLLAMSSVQVANLDTSFDPLRNLDASIIRIGRDPDLSGPFRVDLESDQILLSIDTEAWDWYQSVKTRVPQTMMMSMVLPVVAEAIMNMQRPDADEVYGTFKWYQRIRQISDVRPHIEIDTGSPLRIAQQLLDSPHRNGLEELDQELFKEDEE